MTLHDLIATLTNAEMTLGNVDVAVIPVSDLLLDGFYAREVKTITSVFSLERELQLVIITED